MIDKEKAQGKAEQFKGKVKQVVGRATGSKEIENRGKVDEIRGQARETVADVKIEAKKVVRQAEQTIANA